MRDGKKKLTNIKECMENSKTGAKCENGKAPNQNRAFKSLELDTNKACTCVCARVYTFEFRREKVECQSSVRFASGLLRCGDDRNSGLNSNPLFCVEATKKQMVQKFERNRPRRANDNDNSCQMIRIYRMLTRVRMCVCAID